MNFISKIFIAIIILLPAVSFAGATEQNYDGAAYFYRASGAGTTLSSNARTSTKDDYLEIYIDFDDYLSQNNYMGMLGELTYNLTGATSIFVDYELDVIAGTCNFILHWGYPSTGPASYQWATTTAVDIPRTTQTQSQNHSGSKGIMPLLRQGSGAVCEATLKIYDMGDSNGNDYLTFLTQSQSQTIYVPVQSEITALECISNSPTSTCSFSYSTTTASTTPDYSPHFDLFLLFVGLSFFALAIYLFRALALKYL